MSDVTPTAVLARVARSVPPECLPNIIVIGSLAAGYSLFPDSRGMYVRTKDIDTVLRPREQAVASGTAVAEQLLTSGWRHKLDGKHSAPGDANTPESDLPAVRLYPPESQEWFVELLTMPEAGDNSGRRWLRLALSSGHYGLPSFSFLPICVHRPLETTFGLYCARVESMALANLLEHPRIRPETMSSLIAERAIKRSNKDLGRVLALARLSEPDIIEGWIDEWVESLSACFPEQWQALGRAAGSGLRELLESQSDLAQAVHTCNNGLLAAEPVTAEQLTIEGRRLLMDAIEPLERRCREP